MLVKMRIFRTGSYTGTLLLLLAIAVASTQALYDNDEVAKRGIYQLHVSGNSSSTYPSWPGLTGTAYPASLTDDEPPITMESPEAHSAQTALVPASGPNTVTTTSIPPALAVSQGSPTPTQTSVSPLETSQSTSSLGVGTSAFASVQSGSSATSKTAISSSYSYASDSTTKISSATGDYALTVGPSGEVGLQDISTTSPLEQTSTTEANAASTTLAGGLSIPYASLDQTSTTEASAASTTLAGGSSIPYAVGTANRGPMPGGPSITPWSNGTVGSNTTRGNSSSIVPYLGAAGRLDSGASIWWIAATVLCATLAL